MSAAEGLPVSEYAAKKADRVVAEAMAHEDLAERIFALIQSGTTMRDSDRVIDEHPFPWPHTIRHNSFQHGVLAAVDTLIRAGLTEDKMPVDGLKDLVIEVSNAADRLLEATVTAEGGDIRALYIAEDGGNG